MPILKLRKHPANFSDEDILINPADFPGLKLCDVVEIKPIKASGPNSRILLQVRKWPEVSSYSNTVSIKDSIDNNHLKVYADVSVEIVKKRDNVVDSIEICFSNAYLARSYMWCLRKHLNGRCIYNRQKLDYLNIRSQICEIWAKGNRVTSGCIDDDTKIVFRSASTLVYLFIQMSSEMWDYDINGDLYCEKAINGFLTDLFERWRSNECSHDITIILFSRTYYDAQDISEFPKEMRECLQVDYKNRFYEDYYRVAFQNDRFDLHDWNTKLTILKSLFNQYQKEVIDRHENKYGGVKIPRAYNSSAAQGNFLEVLNMSLNVFEKHYFDRSFDRTGQYSVVVSPGVGVFEVDFDLTHLTKQRIIDNGIGSDLVCLGEQPLHTVPLLKFNSKSSRSDDTKMTTNDVYNMPHWINLSFYSSQNQVYYSNFIPRIKLPTIHSDKTIEAPPSSPMSRTGNPMPSKTGSTPLNDSTKRDSSDTNSKTPNQDNGAYKPDMAQISHAIDSARIASGQQNRHSSLSFLSHNAIPDLVDYDEFDSQIFKSNSTLTSSNTNTGPMNNNKMRNHTGFSESHHQSKNLSQMVFGELEKSSGNDYDSNTSTIPVNDPGRLNSSNRDTSKSSTIADQQDNMMNVSLPEPSDNFGIAISRQESSQIHTPFTRMSLVDSYMSDLKIKPESADDLSIRGYNMQSNRGTRTHHHLASRPKALINPFDPSHMTIKLTPNRRRWTHVFPQGPTGTFIQQHHYQASVGAGVGNSSGGRISVNCSSSPYLANVGTSCQTIVEVDELTALDSRLRLSSNLSLRPSLGLSGGGSNTKGALVSNDTVRFAWCASGEQEWTPAITTGVDWKSLTLPACLPLTTDFFPSKTSLQNDYVIGEYTIDSSCIHSRYSLVEVYRELVCQRLQKGFQIILLPSDSDSAQKYTPNQTKSNSTLPSIISSSSSSMTLSSPLSSTMASLSIRSPTGTTSGSVATRSGARSSKSGRSSTLGGGASSRHSMMGHRTMTLVVGQQLSKTSSGANYCGDASDELDTKFTERTEYIMSIGRIFHKLKLNGDTITVTQYKPRHPYPTMKIEYCYRFRAPFHDAYGQSWVHFKSELLENYSWNYLDNYICARGDSYELRNNLKFWRFRILILPSMLNLRKIKHPGEENNEQDDDGENPDKKTKRSKSSGSGADSKDDQENENPNTSNNYYKTNKQNLQIHYHNCDDAMGKHHDKSGGLSFVSSNQRHDVHYLDFDNDECNSLMDSFVKLLEIINKTRRASVCRLSSSSLSSTMGKTSMDASGMGSQAGDTLSPASFGCLQQQQQQQQHQQQKLQANSRLRYHRDVNITRTRLRVHINVSGSPTSTASSSSSMIAGPDGVSSGSQVTSDSFLEPPPRENQQLGSASMQDGHHPGATPNNDGSIAEHPSSKASCLSAGDPFGDDTNRHPSSSTDDLDSMSLPSFESINMDIDSSLRAAERAEWVHVQYHNYYDVNQAFEFVIKWMVASGAGISEMVQGWSRKAGSQSSVHLVPCPWEPFALPHSGKADPLRCPLGLRLDLAVLKLAGWHSPDDQQVIEFQELILHRFGFVIFHDLISTENIERQYIHMSGFAFVALPNLVGEPSLSGGSGGGVPTKPSFSKPSTPTPRGRLSADQSNEMLGSPQEEYITRHISGARQDKTSRLRGANDHIEFIWSWNYMLTKRWRSPSTMGESYAVSLMLDFKDFCQNGGNRLVEFWHEVKHKL